MAKDYYGILNISKNATDDEIKKAYRRLAIKYHPDKNKNAAAEERFKEIAEAYELLADKRKRHIYDQYSGYNVREESDDMRECRTRRGGIFTYHFHGDPRATFAQFFGAANPFSAVYTQRRNMHRMNENKNAKSHFGAGVRRPLTKSQTTQPTAAQAKVTPPSAAQPVKITTQTTMHQARNTLSPPTIQTPLQPQTPIPAPPPPPPPPPSTTAHEARTNRTRAQTPSPPRPKRTTTPPQSITPHITPWEPSYTPTITSTTSPLNSTTPQPATKTSPTSPIRSESFTVIPIMNPIPMPPPTPPSKPCRKLASSLKQDPAVENDLFCSLEEIDNGCIKKMRLLRDVVDLDGKKHKEEKVLSINVKPGWKEGTKITFQKEGDRLPNTIPADIVFIIRDKPHPIFKRDGSDIHHKVVISLKRALCGTEIEVPTLQGDVLRVDTHGEIINPNTVKRFAGLGLPYHREPNKRGDLVVEIVVKFPQMLQTDQKSKIIEALPD